MNERNIGKNDDWMIFVHFIEINPVQDENYGINDGAEGNNRIKKVNPRFYFLSHFPTKKKESSSFLVTSEFSFELKPAHHSFGITHNPKHDKGHDMFTVRLFY